MATNNLPLSGFQDFLPGRMLPRNEMIALVRACFEKFSFLPQDTPCVERAELLEGKYGDGEKLIYSFCDHGNRRVSLRYDLTVPLGRMIGAYSSAINFPYRRYQVGMVWRADSPGKGRYREFMQMDADIVDDDSVLADVEILLLAGALMETLGVQAIVRFNCRQILDAVAAKCELADTEAVNLMRIIDKFDKIGEPGIRQELAGAGFSDKVVEIIGRYLALSGGSNEQVMSGLADLLAGTPTIEFGFARLSAINDAIRQSGCQAANFRIDPTIARGLDYYTGLIFETTLANNPEFGSVCSGGRYDRMIKHADGRLLPSIGLSIGIDRLLAAMESVGKAPVIKTTTQVMIVNFDGVDIGEYLRLANELRRAGINVEIFSIPAKLAKQMKLASRREVRLALLMGPDEMSRTEVMVKDMRSGTQATVNRADIVSAIRQVFDSK